MGTQQRLPDTASSTSPTKVDLLIDATVSKTDADEGPILGGHENFYRIGGGETNSYGSQESAGYSMINSDSSSSTMVLISSASPSSLSGSTSTLSAASKSPVLNHENLRVKSHFVRRYLKHNPFLNCLLPISCICVLVVIVYLLKDFPKHALHWIERQEAGNSWILIGWFMAMFVVVSFPVTVGYLVLIITSGYLFGFFRGLLVVIVGANFGVAVAHYVIKSLQNKLPVHK